MGNVLVTPEEAMQIRTSRQQTKREGEEERKAEHVKSKRYEALKASAFQNIKHLKGLANGLYENFGNFLDRRAMCK